METKSKNINYRTSGGWVQLKIDVGDNTEDRVNGNMVVSMSHDHSSSIGSSSNITFHACPTMLESIGKMFLDMADEHKRYSPCGNHVNVSLGFGDFLTEVTPDMWEAHVEHNGLIVLPLRRSFPDQDEKVYPRDEFNLRVLRNMAEEGDRLQGAFAGNRLLGVRNPRTNVALASCPGYKSTWVFSKALLKAAVGKEFARKLWKLK